MKTALVVFFKEVMENLRDRRTVTNSLVMGPLIGPVLFAALISVQVRKEVDKSEQPLSVPVINAERAPNLMEFLRQNGIRVKPAIDAPEKAVRNQDTDVVLRVPSDYAESWNKGETAQVEVIYDASLRDTSSTVGRITGALETYNRQNASMRLVARGIAPSVATPLAIAARDQSTPQSRSGLLFSMLPYLLILGSFMGGMYLAIDTTAGERERQSLEPLFATPVPRSGVLTGKLMATFCFAMASLAISLTAFALSGHVLPLDKLDMVIDFGPRFAAVALLVMVPLVMLASVLQTLIAAFAKSYREAQTYLQILLMLPLVPAVMLMVLPVKAQAWMYAVPLLGQHLIVTRLVRGDTVQPTDVGLCIVAGVLAAVVMWFVTARVYRSERLAISG